MARDWVEQVNEDRARRVVGQPASDRVMQMPVAPLTQSQNDFIRGYEYGPTQPTYPVLDSTVPAGRRRYDEVYPKGKGPRPLYPAPGTLYSPGGPQNEPYPGATVERRAEAAMNARAGKNFYSPGGYDASAVAKEGRTGPGFEEFMPEFYGPDQAWDWRAKIRGGMEPSSFGPTSNKDIFIPQGAGGRPNERIIHDYGTGANTGYGSTTVMATADKEGKFNSFSDVPGMRTGPGSGAGGYAAPADPYGINRDLAAARQRVAYHRAGSSLMDRVLAGGAQRRVSKLQQLGIAGGQLDLQTRRYEPDIALANYRNDQLAKRGLSGLQAFTAAAGGHHNLLVLPEILGNRVLRPSDIPEGGQVYRSGTNPTQPVLPTMPAPVTTPYRMSNPDEYYR